MLSKNQNLLILSLYLIYIKRKNQLEKEQNLIPMQHIESNMKILFETKSHLEYLNFIEK